MKLPRCARLILIMTLLLPLSMSVASASPGIPGAAPAQTVRINLGRPITSLDPAFASGSQDFHTVQQLFAGLTRQDEETGAIHPDLASSWSVATDGLSITFNLQPGIAWSDGMAISPGDVIAGLDRALQYSNFAYVLQYAMGVTSYTAVGANAVRIVLSRPVAGVMPATMAFASFRPVPQHVISVHGAGWTEVDHIVSSGPYRVTGGDSQSLWLGKNPLYHDAAAVSIDRMELRFISDATEATQLYAQGLLDASMNYDGSLTGSDPALGSEVHSYTSSCNYYYGFTTTKPPLDNVLVRQALIAATNRAALVAAGYGGQPALTLAPPGVFGAVPAGSGVGIDYDPAQAQAWLAMSGVATPFTITLAHNTSAGHAAIAQRVANDWETNLGIDVVIEDRDWQAYLQWIAPGTPVDVMPHVWRLGWCSDYFDQHGWVYEIFHSQGNNQIRWQNAEFDSITAQAAASGDAAQRLTWYRRAEEILNQEEAGILSLYWYGTSQLSKPYLQRTFSRNGGEQVRNWSFPAGSSTIGPLGGTVTSPDSSTQAIFPTGVFTDDTEVTLYHVSDLPGSSYPLLGTNHAFQIDAEAPAGESFSLTDPVQPFTLTVRYSDWEEGTSVEETLDLYWWDGSGWQPESGMVDTSANTVSATVQNLGTYGLFGTTHRTWLPIIVRRTP